MINYFKSCGVKRYFHPYIDLGDGFTSPLNISDIGIKKDSFSFDYFNMLWTCGDLKTARRTPIENLSAFKTWISYLKKRKFDPKDYIHSSAKILEKIKYDIQTEKSSIYDCMAKIDEICQNKFIETVTSHIYEETFFEHRNYRGPFVYHDENFTVGSRDKIMFFENKDSLLSGNPTVMKFGSYLKKYRPTLSEKDIETLVSKWKGQYCTEYELKITHDTEKIIDVYDNHDGRCTSCLNDYKNSWKTSGINPLNVYGGNSDIGLAYIEDPEKKNTVARALIRPEGKTFIKAYPAALNGAILERLLLNEGYKKIDTAFNGARLNRIDLPAGSDYHRTHVVMPYLDGPKTGSGTRQRVQIMDDHLVVENNRELGVVACNYETSLVRITDQRKM